MQARRYQYGNLTLRKREKGPDVWQFRWMENGKPKSVLIGTVEKYRNQVDAERAVEHLRIKINAQNPQQQFHRLTVGALIDRFMNEYTPKRCRENTRKNYLSLFKNHIRPQWGRELVQNVKTMAIENWLETYPHSRQVKAHVRTLMHILFQAALRWEMAERNPVDLVRQSSKRLKRPRVLTAEEFKLLLAQLNEPYRTMAITVACLGLRVSELVALQYSGVTLTLEASPSRCSVALCGERSTRPRPKHPKVRYRWILTWRTCFWRTRRIPSLRPIRITSSRGTQENRVGRTAYSLTTSSLRRLGRELEASGGTRSGTIPSPGLLPSDRRDQSR